MTRETRKHLAGLPILACAALSAGAISLGSTRSPSGDCVPLPPPHVLVEEESALLQYWVVADAQHLRGPTLPDSPSLLAFRDAISRAVDTDPRHLLEQQLPLVDGGDAENVRIVLSGDAGTIRPMNCLEALLLATQTERSARKGYSMYSRPTEFLSYVLVRGDSLKVWYYTVDQAGVRALGRLHDPVTADVRAGWAVRTNIHNHNFFPDSARVLGGVVPSATDVQALRNMRTSIGLTRASITNGFHTIDIEPADVDRFRGP